MTDLKKKKARWFGLAFAAFAVMCTAGKVYWQLCPLCIAAMIVCIRKGQLWDWGGVK